MSWGNEQRAVSRRTLLRGASIATGAGVLAACAAGGQAPAPQQKSQQPATIRFAAAGIGTELDIWTEVTKTYNSLGTGITVQYEPCTAGSASAQDCLPVYFAEYIAGSAPDVWRGDDEPPPLYPRKGIFLELRPPFPPATKEIQPPPFFPPPPA